MHRGFGLCRLFYKPNFRAIFFRGFAWRNIFSFRRPFSLCRVWFGSGNIYARINLNQYIQQGLVKRKLGWVVLIGGDNLNTEAWTQGATEMAEMELARSCVQICVQSKRKSSHESTRNCLIFRGWSHMGLNHGLPDYESGALTNWAIGP